jgi:hypothetical protein
MSARQFAKQVRPIFDAIRLITGERPHSISHADDELVVTGLTAHARW